MDTREDDIHARIKELVDAEHELRRKIEAGELDPDAERKRLSQLETTLDQCWDLLRQRRALIEHGQPPDLARVNPPSQVEGYLQ